MSHCTYRACQFDEETSARLVGNSKRYNVFLRTRVELPVEAVDFLRRNFGVEGPPGLSIREMDIDGPLLQMSLDVYCRSAHLRSVLQHALQALEELAPGGDMSGQARLKYVGLVLRSLVEDGRLPPITVLYVSDRLLSIANQARSHSFAVEMLGLVMHHRAHLAETLQRLKEETKGEAHLVSGGTTLTGVLERKYSNEFVKELLVWTCSLSQTEPSVAKVVSVRPGSTLLEVVFSAPVVLGMWVKGLNFLFAQVRVSVKQVEGIRSDLQRALDKPAQSTPATSPQDAALLPLPAAYAIRGLDGDGDVMRMRQLLGNTQDQILELEGTAEFSFSVR
jgi:hypothetical protein